MDDDGFNIWYTVTANEMAPIQNIMIGLQRAAMNTVLFANMVPHSMVHWVDGRGQTGRSKQMQAMARAVAARVTDPPGDLPLAAAIEGLAGGAAAGLVEPAVGVVGAVLRKAADVLAPLPQTATVDLGLGVNPNSA